MPTDSLQNRWCNCQCSPVDTCWHCFKHYNFLFASSASQTDFATRCVMLSSFRHSMELLWSVQQHVTFDPNLWWTWVILSIIKGSVQRYMWSYNSRGLLFLVLLLTLRIWLRRHFWAQRDFIHIHYLNWQLLQNCSRHDMRTRWHVTNCCLWGSWRLVLPTAVGVKFKPLQFCTQKNCSEPIMSLDYTR